MTQNKSTQQTKEDILGAGKSIPSNLGDIDMYMKEHCLAAMDEYAKTTAVAFASFLRDVYYLDGEGFYHHDYQSKVHFTIDSLYTTFINDHPSITP